MHTLPNSETSHVDTPNPLARTSTPKTSRLAFSHPKNYLGVPVAVRDSRATGPLVTGYIVDTAGQAKQGAQELGLITQQGALTQYGQDVAETFVDVFETTTEALRVLDTWRGSATQFCSLEPALKHTTQQVFARYEPVQELLAVVSEQPDNECVVSTLARNTRLAQYVLRDPDNPGDLSSPDAYQSHTTFQLKSCLYHAGLVHHPGRSTDCLVPEQDVWSLTEDALEVLE